MSDNLNDVVISGISGRYIDADDPELFWQGLVNKTEIKLIDDQCLCGKYSKYWELIRLIFTLLLIEFFWINQNRKIWFTCKKR